LLGRQRHDALLFQGNGAIGPSTPFIAAARLSRAALVPLSMPMIDAG